MLRDILPEIIVGAFGLAGIGLTYYLKNKPDAERQTVSETVTNLREDLKNARIDAHEAREDAKRAVVRVESLEERERRRFQYELRHRQWDMQAFLSIRSVDPDFPHPPPFSILDPFNFEPPQQTDPAELEEGRHE